MTVAPKKLRFDVLIAIQFAVIALVGLGTIFAPPRQGEMMLLALSGHSLVTATNIIVGRGGRIVAQGPGRNSLIISGRRDILFLPALMGGGLLVSGPARLCGGKDGEK